MRFGWGVFPVIPLVMIPGVLSAGDDPSSLAYSNDRLSALIQEKDLHDIPSVVGALPDFIRQNLTFVFESASAQEAHLVLKDGSGEHSGVEDPRAILWDEQGKFFLSFNGAPQSPGYNSIETLEFKETPATLRFHFSGLQFKSGVDRPTTSVDEKKCALCHGRNPRPIWGEYPTWTGSYGSREDIMQPGEKGAYERFRASALANDLYSPLFPAQAWENFPYKKDANVDVMSESHTFRYRPNTRMSTLLNRLNAKRVMSLLRSQSNYRTDRPSLAYAFLGCGEDREGSALLERYGLSMRDVDMRYPYYDSHYDDKAFSDSYFDGASTFNELMAAALVADLAKDDAHSNLGSARYDTLANLYQSNYHKRLDSEFFAMADALGPWIRTPFPREQHRTKLRPLPNVVEIENVKNLCAELGAMKDHTVTGARERGDVIRNASYDLVRKQVFMEGQCLACHNQAAHNPGGVNLESYDGVVANARRIWAAVETDFMPYRRAPLSDDQKQLLRVWVQDGTAR